jgi:hypothetical protein
MFKLTKLIEGVKARQGEQGNVLFLILIAVALFAALSYAVTQSSRTGGGATDGESNLVNSAQITQYPASVRTAIVRMKINGVEDSQLNFDRPADFATTCDAAPEPCVFHPQGGGATSVTAPPEVMMASTQGNWIFTSDFAIASVGTTGATNASNDIIAFLPGIKQSICERLNKELGVTVDANADGDGVAAGGVALANIPVVGDEMDNGNAGIGPAAQGASKEIGGNFAGQPFGCADFDAASNSATDADLAYYHVLLER